MSRDEPLHRLWVGGLPSDARDSDVIAMFEPFGSVSDVKIRTSNKDIYCFLSLAGDGADAIKALDQAKILGKTVKVANANAEKSERRRSPERRQRSRSRSRRRQRSPSEESRGRQSIIRVPKGNIRLRIESLPVDMSWQELKNLGQDYASSTSAVTFSRTWKERGEGVGTLEFSDKREADKVRAALDGKRIEGCERRLTVEFERERSLIRQRSPLDIPRRRRY